jgi:rhamnosyltransferase
MGNGGFVRHMKLSVVIPALNEEKTLEQTLSSINKQQTTHDVEIVIVDSYSKDKTLEIAKRFTDKIFFTPPGIIAVARQKGTLEAQGTIVISACADTVYDPCWLEELVLPIVKGTSIGTAGKLLPFEGNLVENVFSKYLLSPFATCAFACGIPYLGGESMAFTKEAFMKVNGYRTELVTGEDVDLMKRLKAVGKIAYCPNSVALLSTRRIRKWGYAKYVWFHGTNFVRTHFSGKVHGTYEPVR